MKAANTALAAAFKRAGAPDHETRLLDLARAAVDHAPRDHGTARAALLAALPDDPALLKFIIVRAPACLDDWLRTAARAATNGTSETKGLSSQRAPASLGGHAEGGNHPSFAAAGGPAIHRATSTPLAPFRPLSTLAAAGAAAQIALTILDTFRLFERPAGNWLIRELRIVTPGKRIQARIAAAILRRVGNRDPGNLRVRDVVSAEEFESIVKAARGENDEEI